MSTISEYIEEEQQWIEDNANAYREAQENMSNAEYVRGLLRGVEEKIAPLLAFNPKEDPEHAAVFICGAVQARFDRLLTHLDFLDDYESRRKDLNETIAKAESPEPEDHSGDLGEVGEL